MLLTREESWKEVKLGRAFKAELLVERSRQLEQLSTTLVVDGYFAKRKFIDRILEQTNMEVICRLRDDANLKYLAATASTNKGRSRPKLYAGKVEAIKLISGGSEKNIGIQK